MEYFVSGLWIALEMVSIVVFCLAFLKYKQKSRNYLWCILTWIIICVFSFWKITKPFIAYISYPVIFLLLLHLFSGKWYMYLFLEILCVMFLMIADSAVAYGTCAFLKISLAELVWRKFTYAMFGTIGKLIVLLCAWMIYCFRNANGLKGIHGKWLLLTMLFPILSTLIVFLNYHNNSNSSDVSGSVFAISMVLMISNVGIVYLIHSLEKATNQEQEMVLLKQQIAHQKDNYDALENSYRVQRKSSHEFERHIQTLCDLLDQNAYGTASDYAHRLSRSRSRHVFAIKSNHTVIDVILNQKYQMAQDWNIKMQIQVNDLSQVDIQTDLLVVLLSNLLDNAIEACRNVDGRKEIYCKIVYSMGLYLSVRNTSRPVNICENEIIADAPIEHGYGIPAIKHVLEQVHAEYYFEYHDGWFCFATDIPE